MIVGHQGVIGALSSQLPPVSVITGPASVGKRMIAAYAAMRNDVARIDFTEVRRLTISEASRIKDFMQTRPTRNLKFALIDLDMASTPAINDLLKTLEEPPEYARFSLISSSRLPTTVLTRAQHYTVGLLAPEDLYTILVDKGIPEADAHTLSKLGRVDLALQTYSDMSAKTTAMNVLSAVLSGDYALFCQAYKAVDEKAAKMILTALEESASQNWKVFDPKQLGPFAKRAAGIKVLGLWSPVSAARQQFAIRVALESVMKG
jgi:DNA polymerase III delta prime subunit